MSSKNPETKDWNYEIVRCPISGERLSPADRELTETLEQIAESGKLCNQGGDVIRPPIVGGLVNESKHFFYRDIAGVLLLTVEEAIDITRVAAGERLS